MQASPRAPDPPATPSRPCEHCATPNIEAAKYCKQCGASLAPPPVCPSCRADVPKDARFCSSCGAKLVGARGPAASSVAPADPVDVSVATKVAAAAQVEMTAARGPKKKAGSNMAGNVLLFVAACAIFIVVMYVANRDAPKSVSPFMGGPPPSQQSGSTEPSPSASPSKTPSEAPVAAAAPSGAPIRGVVKLDPSVAGSAPNGTVFIIARMAGMPDRGPPIAVTKIDRPTFPVSFELGPSDVMMEGMPFSGPFDLYVRLDADGNAMTKEAGDLLLSQPKAGVTPGSSVEIVLDKRL